MNSYKITVWGTYSCGKTCLTYRYAHGKWLTDTCSTIGAAFSNKKINILVDGKPKQISLGLWDTSGSERYRSMTNGYLRKSDMVLFCIDGSTVSGFKSKDFCHGDPRGYIEREITIKNIITSLNEIREGMQRGESKYKDIVLVITKSDKIKNTDHPLFKCMEELVTENPDILGLYFTSSVTGDGVDELFNQIILELVNRNLVELPPPLSLQPLPNKPKSRWSKLCAI